jgi:hypothetical protein
VSGARFFRRCCLSECSSDPGVFEWSRHRTVVNIQNLCEQDQHAPGIARYERSGDAGEFCGPNSVVLCPGQKTCQKIGSGPSQYFHSTDVENACADWQKVADKQVKCEKMEEDFVGGRRTIKYKNSLADGGAEYVWIDTKLSYVIK